MPKHEILRKALDLIELSRYEEAFELLLALANLDILEAQENLGVMYQLGLGTNRNIQQAIYWLKQAANAGSGIAAHNLGTLYQTCEPEIPVDMKKSLYWFNLANKLGFYPGVKNCDVRHEGNSPTR